jgi:adenosylmethionine-8-amino-7-oxononanoate aminotransferase
MQWLWDNEGERYLDMFGGIVTVSVGHCHPKVNEALKQQVDTLWHTTSIYLQVFCIRICKFSPIGELYLLQPIHLSTKGLKIFQNFSK